MRPINEIIIHCTDTPPSWGATLTPQQQVYEIRRWHVEGNGWKDIGYHYVITRDGTVVKGRPVDQVGAHVKGHNTGTIGVSLVGGKGGSADDTFSQHFTDAQNAALRNLIDALRRDFPAIKKISGHNEYAAKACPCFRVAAWKDYAPAPAPRNNVSQSKTVQASAVQIVSAGTAGVGAFAALDGTAQIVAMVIAGIIGLAALFIIKERVKAWASGWR